MKISLSSVSFAIKLRSSSELISRNSPGSDTRPRERARAPEIITSSPENWPGPYVTITCSPESWGTAMFSFPESTTKQGILNSPGSIRTSPAWTDRTLP
jgi:hypothetical protein